jgi:FkbM family methyltransferase
MLRDVTIRFLRFGFRIWPFMHGRGWILRAAKLLLGSGPVRFDVGGGTFIEGPLSDYVIVWTFMRGHERDAPFQKSLALLQPGDFAIDAGANLGVWSLLASKRGAWIEAFEPAPAMAARLRAHIASNRASAAAYDIALGAERTTLPFFAVSDGNTGASSLARHHDAAVETHVEVAPLDDMFSRATFLKVDVEGAEILVFRGARRILSSDDAPIVFFEVVDRFCRDFGTTSAGVKQFLVDCGYGIYRWDGRRFTAVDVNESHEQEDLFALKRQHMARIG